ncbi:MAG TPA: tetratricopeptide repeat protein [Phycisphaerae bacterium]|nr:tetratricopeptide repeat protein [Phycisphaerae bacterium]
MSPMFLLLSVFTTAQTTGPVDGHPMRFLVARIVATDKATEPWVGTALETGLAWHLRRHPLIDAVPIPWRDRAMRDAGYLPAAPNMQLADAKRLAKLLGVGSLVTGTCRTELTQLVVELQVHDMHTEQTQRCVATGKDVRELLADAVARLVAMCVPPIRPPQSVAANMPAYSRSASAIEYYAKALRGHQTEQLGRVPFYCAQALQSDGKFRDAMILLALHEVRQGNVANAIRRFQQVVRDAQLADDRVDLARAQGNLGWLYRQLGRHEVAQRYLELAADTARQADDPYNLATALNNLAQLAGSADQPQQAVQHLRARQQLLTQLGDQLGTAPNLVFLGTVYEQLEQYDEALATYQQAIEWIHKAGPAAALPEALSHLASAYEHLKQADLAIENYRKSLQLSDPTDPVRILCNNSLGLIYQKQNDYDLALEAFGQALEGLTRSGDGQARAICLSNIAMVYEERGQWPQAIENLNQAVNILRGLQHPQLAQYEALLNEMRSKSASATDAANR